MRKKVHTAGRAQQRQPDTDTPSIPTGARHTGGDRGAEDSSGSTPSSRAPSDPGLVRARTQAPSPQLSQPTPRRCDGARGTGGAKASTRERRAASGVGGSTRQRRRSCAGHCVRLLRRALLAFMEQNKGRAPHARAAYPHDPAPRVPLFNCTAEALTSRSRATSLGQIAS